MLADKSERILLSYVKYTVYGTFRPDLPSAFSGCIEFGMPYRATVLNCMVRCGIRICCTLFQLNFAINIS